METKEELYKQLKRLEFDIEVERQRKKEEKEHRIFLEQENEELKKEVKEQEDLANECISLGGKYLQALEEIREFSENFCSDNCPYYEVEETNICNDGCLLDNIVNPIIDKINEVLKEQTNERN